MSSDKTAIERLRELLDERGVEWDTFPFGNTEYTHWTSRDGRWCEAISCGSQLLHVNILGASPEQAIAATLGPGTCHDAGGTNENGQQVFNCDACGCVLSLYDRDGTNTMCTHYIYDYPRFCPACGRKVVDE